jgi:hypothetical protein
MDIIKLAQMIYGTKATEQEIRFATLIAEAVREECIEKTGEFARKWWSIHCATNKNLEITRKAHDDFCILQIEIRKMVRIPLDDENLKK